MESSFEFGVSSGSIPCQVISCAMPLKTTSPLSPVVEKKKARNFIHNASMPSLSLVVLFPIFGIPTTFNNLFNTAFCR